MVAKIIRLLTTVNGKKDFTERYLFKAMLKKIKPELAALGIENFGKAKNVKNSDAHCSFLILAGVFNQEIYNRLINWSFSVYHYEQNKSYIKSEIQKLKKQLNRIAA